MPNFKAKSKKKLGVEKANQPFPHRVLFKKLVNDQTYSRFIALRRFISVREND